MNNYNVVILMTMLLFSACKNKMAHPLKAIADVAPSSPGLQYMMMKDFQVVVEANRGVADMTTKRPVESSTIFNANSVTKTFTAVAIMKLADQGRLRLDDLVSNVINDIPFKWDITIEQLLTHSSGLRNPIPLKWIHLRDKHETFDATAFFSSVLKVNYDQSWPPGTGYRYSNINYLVLGRIIEKVIGLPYEHFIRLAILDPINCDLTFHMQDDSKYAYGYQKRYTLMSGLLGFFLDEKQFIRKKEAGWLEFKPFYNNGAAYGGLIGSAKGFNLYLQELMRKDSRLITLESRLAMLTPTEVSKGVMCFSWFTGELDGHRYFCHAGGGGGHYCEIRFYPDLNVSSVIMLNRSGMRDERLLDKIDKCFLERLAATPPGRI